MIKVKSFKDNFNKKELHVDGERLIQKLSEADLRFRLTYEENAKKALQEKDTGPLYSMYELWKATRLIKKNLHETEMIKYYKKYLEQIGAIVP